MHCGTLEPIGPAYDDFIVKKAKALWGGGGGGEERERDTGGGNWNSRFTLVVYRVNGGSLLWFHERCQGFPFLFGTKQSEWTILEP